MVRSFSTPAARLVVAKIMKTRSKSFQTAAKTKISDDDKNMLPLKQIAFLGNNE